MHIAVVTSSYPRHDADPAGHFVRSEVQALVQDGHQVTVLAPHARSHFCAGNPALQWLASGDAFGSPGVLARVKAMPWRAWRVAQFALAARRALRALPHDQVIAHWLLPAAWPIATLSPYRSPFSTAAGARVRPTLEVVVHGSDAQLLQRAPRPLAQALLRTLRQRGASVRCVSHALRAQLTHLEPSLVDCTHVRLPALSVPQLDRVAARRSLGLPSDEFLAVVVGRLVAGKRVHVALQHAPCPPGRWVVIGDGPEQAALKQRFPHVHFMGALPRPLTLQWIAAADVLVSASLHEGAPTVIREARALGTEVWTAPVGDVVMWATEDPGIRVLAELGETAPQFGTR